MIRVDSVYKRYGGTVVIDGVRLELQAGGVTAIIGPNGAGKSTLLSMIGRILEVDSGIITVDGLDVSKTPGSALAQRLSILSQENAITARLTVEDLVTFGRYPYSRGRLSPADMQHVETALSYMDLLSKRGRFLDQLSGGEKQRAYVAMILCQDTDYILLDEPLNNLDVHHAVAIMHTIKRFADELGKTVVMVIHDINFAAAYSDWIVGIRDGRVYCQGASEHVIVPGVLEGLFGTPFRVHLIEGQRIAAYYR